jgi:hypothetical protein
MVMRLNRTLVLLGVVAVLAAALPAAGSATPPNVVAVVTIGTAGDSGWYVSNVTVRFDITGTVTSSSGCDIATLTSEGINSSLKCTVSGPEGSATSQPIFKIDKTAPSVSGSTDRGPNGNGWFNAPVTVSFSGSDATSGVASCTQATYGGPDSAGASVGGTCRDVAGNVGSGGTSIRYDATPPTVTAAPERGPDVNGWYNHPLTIGYNGSDATSGVESCSSTKYGGPDNAAASVGGNCTDKAGNTGAGTLALKYDSSPPKLTALSVATSNHRAILRWNASSDTTAVTVTRLASKKGAKTTVVYRGKANSVSDGKLTNGLRYRYTIYSVDQAGNVAKASTVATPRALSSPADGARLRAPPLLKWSALPGASYYNVQLFRGRQKILSVWPRGTSLKLQRTWAYGGRSFRLEPGRYAWYVWPGIGLRSAAHYGKLLGGSVFYIRR